MQETAPHRSELALASMAIDHLNRHRAEGYAASTHAMSFPRAMRPAAGRQIQAGDVFLRAIIAEALCDARDAGLLDPSEHLVRECDYLVARRRRDNIGGWSYFPDLVELPSDIDDLAQIIQVLVRCGRTDDLRNFVEPPLSIVLRNGLRADGAIRTWILRSVPATPVEERQAAFVRNAWGDDPDVEVIANFLYGLLLYERPRFTQVIERGTQYVSRRQQGDGSWQSSWYAGPFYGTYVCVRLLAVLGQRDALDRASGFLLAAQRSDGGWGFGESSDQLSTALAVCTLLALADGRCGLDDASLDRAVTSSIAAMKRDAWDEPTFIRMNTGRARGSDGPWLRYASSAVTASYVLKAAAALARRNSRPPSH